MWEKICSKLGFVFETGSSAETHKPLTTVVLRFLRHHDATRSFLMFSDPGTNYTGAEGLFCALHCNSVHSLTIR